MTVKEQILGVLRSRKFWAMAASIAAVWTAYFTAPGALTTAQAVQATVAALAAYAIGTGLEGPRVVPEPEPRKINFANTGTSSNTMPGYIVSVPVENTPANAPKG